MVDELFMTIHRNEHASLSCSKKSADDVLNKF